MKKVICMAMAVLLTFALSAPVYAADTPSLKEESVYGILNADGSVDSIYVVNSFGGGDITDYGSYTKIQNLTSSEQLMQSGDTIKVSTSSDKLYYQGTLDSKALPWNITISYSLDGTDTAGSELAGKSGELKIHLIVTQNPDVRDTFYKNFALQIGIKLDTQLCDNIDAPNSTVAQAGGSKQLTYTVLPGNGADITVSADVHDFEMEAITVNGIRMAMSFNFDTESFTEQITQLQDAIAQLDDGAGELSGGAKQLSEGLDKYVAGIKSFSEGLSQLSGGMSGINSGAVQLRDGLNALSGQNDTLMDGALAIQKSTFGAVNGQLVQMGLGLPVLTPENYVAVIGNISSLASVKAQLDGVVQFTQGLKGYTDSIAQLSSGASLLADGTGKMKSSVSAVAYSANELYKAGEEINSALKKLSDGLISYKEGTAEMRSETSGMDEEIDKQIKEIMDGISGNGDAVSSFVSEKNTNISAVQFVLKTSAINIPEADAPAQEEPVRLNFWQKLLALFGINV